MTWSSADLVVTDLDGSLWADASTLHDETSAALERIAAENVTVLVATGRRRASAGGPLAGHGLAHLPRVLLNGSLGLDGEIVFQLETFSSAQVSAIIEICAEEGHVPCAYVEHAELDVYCAGEPTTSDRHKRLLAGAITVGGPGRVVEELDVVGFALLGVPPDPLERIARAIAAAGHGKPVLSADSIYGAHSLMVQPPGVSKWEGIERFCAHRGLDASRVVAVGDGTNDHEMIRNAAVGIVPRDAAEETRALADEVVAGPGEGGWREVIEVLDGLR